MLSVQIILLIPLGVKLQALEYRRWWWSTFPYKQLALGYWEMSTVESVQIFRVVKSALTAFEKR